MKIVLFLFVCLIKYVFLNKDYVVEFLGFGFLLFLVLDEEILFSMRVMKKMNMFKWFCVD